MSIVNQPWMTIKTGFITKTETDTVAVVLKIKASLETEFKIVLTKF